MLKPSHNLHKSMKLVSSSWVCLSCQNKSQWLARHTSNASSSPKPAPPQTSRRNEEAPILKPLSRPIGQLNPPQPGENNGKDERTWRQRRDDFFDYDKHLERRSKLTRQVAKPYFRDWTNMRHHKGKTFLSPSRPFKAEAARYFPNMQGYTLADSSTLSDTTNVLAGKTSIVSVVSETWADWQALSFVGEKQNEELEKEVQRLKDRGLQRVRINIEEDMLKAALVWLFLGYARKKTRKEDWKRSFVVTRGVEEETKLDIAMTNGKVGHVYLVDKNCKIRWAGNGYADDEERANLVHVTRRLVEGNPTGVKQSTAVSGKKAAKITVPGEEAEEKAVIRGKAAVATK